MTAQSTVFLFPGQGSQSLGMMSEFAAGQGPVLETFTEASDLLGFDLWQLCQEGPVEDLNSTANTQPAMLTAGVATWRDWLAQGGAKPGLMAGHSLGEYSALVAAEALEFADALQLVRRRGQLMQDAVPQGEGAMAAIIGMEEAPLEALCAEVAGEQVVSCANYNAPGQIVIAGHLEAVQRACDAALEAGARRALPLPVSVPSHCLLMREAAGELALTLADVNIESPRIPVIHNADVQDHPGAQAIRDILARQLWQPVRWTRTIEHFINGGAERLVECGPGKVLTGLNRRIARRTSATALVDGPSISALLKESDS